MVGDPVPAPERGGAGAVGSVGSAAATGIVRIAAAAAVRAGSTAIPSAPDVVFSLVAGYAFAFFSAERVVGGKCRVGTECRCVVAHERASAEAARGGINGTAGVDDGISLHFHDEHTANSTVPVVTRKNAAGIDGERGKTGNADHLDLAGCTAYRVIIIRGAALELDGGGVGNRTDLLEFITAAAVIVSRVDASPCRIRAVGHVELVADDRAYGLVDHDHVAGGKVAGKTAVCVQRAVGDRDRGGACENVGGYSRVFVHDRVGGGNCSWAVNTLLGIKEK